MAMQPRTKPFEEGDIVKVIADIGADEGFFIGMMGRVVDDSGDGWVGVHLEASPDDETDFQRAELRAASAKERDEYLARHTLTSSQVDITEPDPD